MPELPDEISGRKWGRLTAIKKSIRDKWGKRQWEFSCECGAIVVLDASRVKSGRTGSCGCLHKDLMRARLAKHGMKRHPLYRIWSGMKDRCNNTNNSHFHRYGGRGIRVCQRWSDSFPAFIEDMGERPSRSHSLERINNNGNYEPGNCRWATSSEQCRNTRRNTFLTFRGQTLSLPEWSDRLGIPYHRLRSRISNGWTAERALTVLEDGRTARWK